MYVCAGVLLFIGCGEAPRSSDLTCDPGTHEENGQCAPDRDNADTTDPPNNIAEKFHQGPFTITNTMEVKTLDGVTAITGDLNINAPGLSSIELPSLTSVGGNLDMQSNDVLESFSLPALTEVGGFLSVSSNTALTSFDLPKLSKVGGQMDLKDSVLTSFHLPELQSVGSGLWVENNNAMTSFDLPKLTTVGDELKVYYHDVLTSLTLPALTEIGNDFDLWGNSMLETVTCPVLSVITYNLIIQDNEALAKTSLDLPALTSVTSLWLSGNSAMTSFSMPLLAKVGDNLSVHDNTRLDLFDLSALTQVGGTFQIGTNPALAQCLIDALLAQIQAGEGVGTNTKTDSNNGYCTCTDFKGVLEASCP